MKKGDWVELRDTPNTRAIIKSVYCPTRVSLRLSGDRAPVTISATDLERHWEPMPFEGSAPAWWCKPGDTFKPVRPMGYTHVFSNVTIFDTRPGWVAYYESNGGRLGGTFWIQEWWHFRQTWDPVEPPTAWGTVLHAMDLGED